MQLHRLFWGSPNRKAGLIQNYSPAMNYGPTLSYDPILGYGPTLGSDPTLGYGPTLGYDPMKYGPTLGYGPTTNGPCHETRPLDILEAQVIFQNFHSKEQVLPLWILYSQTAFLSPLLTVTSSPCEN